MASFKMMSSSNSRNSDLPRRNSSTASSSPSIRSHNLRRDPHADHSRLSFGYGGGNDVTIRDYTFASDQKRLVTDRSNEDRSSFNGGRKSVEDVWKEIISGDKKKIMKEEAQEEEEDVVTLEDFLAAIDDDGEIDVKIPAERVPMMTQQHNTFQMIEGSMGRRKRERLMMIETMDKASVQRQKRMIKNRESAARSRERKQAYQVKLETLATKLEKENEKLLKEIEEMSKERYRKLMEQLITVDQKPKPLSRSLSRSRSLEW